MIKAHVCKKNSVRGEELNLITGPHGVFKKMAMVTGYHDAVKHGLYSGFILCISICEICVLHCAIKWKYYSLKQMLPRACGDEL